MVIFFEWHQTAVEPKSSSCLPMTGEDTGLGALASPLAGYLGKVQERAASLDYCPWCTSKGFTYVLRSYRINLKESITLCTNPECLFPLVTRPLEDVLASLDPVEPAVGNKRKNVSALEEEELIEPPLKCLRSSKLDDAGSVTGGPAEHCAVNTVTNGQHAATTTDGVKINGYPWDCPVAETTGWESVQDKDVVPENDPNDAVQADRLGPPTCSASAGHSAEVSLLTDGDKTVLSPQCGALGTTEVDNRQGRSPPKVLSRCGSLGSEQCFFTVKDIHSSDINNPSTAGIEQKSLTDQHKGVPKSESESTSLTGSEELVLVPKQLFWRNSENLCWLDSLLAALLNCKSLRKWKPKDEAQRSAVWRLMTGYENICAAVQDHHQTGRDGVVRVPDHVLQKANVHLQSLRMSVFELLQPKLHCKLGQRETPVFAMPLLLAMDSWAERLFQSTFHWEFKCSECKIATKERVVKTLPTFTNIVPDWRPLRAVHSAPCNVCHKKNETRAMTLERVSPVFALHFVDGLPNKDVNIYTFNFKGRRYSITTVIQYNHRLKHFVTWICNSDGSWLEYDDLKHPDCQTHEKLQVPANEMHIVFWEAEEDEEPLTCSPSTTFTESPPPENDRIPSVGNKDLAEDEPLIQTPDRSLVLPHNDTDIVCALSEDNSHIMDTTVTVGMDTSIGAVTLLDTFDGLSHSDIITLTLTEINAEMETQPLNDAQQSHDVCVPSGNDIPDSTPDSSSCPVGESEVCPDPEAELPTTSSSSDHESGDNSSSDPTFVPGARRVSGKGAGRGKTVSSQKGKKTTEAAPRTSPPPPPPPPTSSEPSTVIRDKPVGLAQNNTTPAAITQQASLVSSSDTSPPCTSQKGPTVRSALDPNAHWSFMLSKHPLSQVQRAPTKPAPTHPPAPVSNPSHPLHSTPNPLKRPQTPAVLHPKPQLRTEEGDGLPPKAAEMYGAFGARSSNTQSPPLSPTLPGGQSQSFQPITSTHQPSTTALSATSLRTPAAKGLPEISSSKKHGSHPSKVPLGLSSTDALRYKLIKKLKAKKKKLAKLNQLLGGQGGASLWPDSTDLCSPSTVTSSTYDGSTCDDFLSDLLSPATTASNLSPDSTGFLEMLTNGQDGGAERLDWVVGAAQTNNGTNQPDTENFLDEFLSQAEAQRPTDMEAEALSALQLFI